MIGTVPLRERRPPDRDHDRVFFCLPRVADPRPPENEVALSFEYDGSDGQVEPDRRTPRPHVGPGRSRRTTRRRAAPPAKHAGLAIGARVRRHQDPKLSAHPRITRQSGRRPTCPSRPSADDLPAGRIEMARPDGQQMAVTERVSDVLFRHGSDSAHAGPNTCARQRSWPWRTESNTTSVCSTTPEGGPFDNPHQS